VSRGVRASSVSVLLFGICLLSVGYCYVRAFIEAGEERFWLGTFLVLSPLAAGGGAFMVFGRRSMRFRILAAACGVVVGFMLTYETANLADSTYEFLKAR